MGITIKFKINGQAWGVIRRCLPVFMGMINVENCTLCPRLCGASRGKIRGGGFCGCGTMPVISRAALHMWEEPVISGRRGSGTIFFSGCTLRCVFCQNYEISSALRGRALTPRALADIMRELEHSGAHNISFVTGTQYVPAIIEALGIYRPSLPLVWNSGGYESADTLKMLGKYIDIWLPDYKFALSDVASRYCHAADYPEIAINAIALMCKLSADGGGEVIEDGVMKHGIIVRHLVLPHNLRNSVAALRKIRSTLPEGTPVSIMSQYTPSGNIAGFPELRSCITQREYEKIRRVADQLGIEGFAQELSSASGEYVPQFDLSDPGSDSD